MDWLGVETNTAPPTGRGSARFLFWFGLASLVYRWYVTALTMFFLYEFMKQHHVPVVGWGLAAISLTALIGVPIWQLVRWLCQQGRFPDMKPARLWLSFAGFAGLAVFVFLIPLPMKVRGVALVQPVPEQVRRVIVPETEGCLQEVYVRDGQHVRAGEVLAVLVNPKLEVKIRVNEDAALGARRERGVAEGAAHRPRFPISGGRRRVGRAVSSWCRRLQILIIPREIASEPIAHE